MDLEPLWALGLSRWGWFAFLLLVEEADRGEGLRLQEACLREPQLSQSDRACCLLWVLMIR